MRKILTVLSLAAVLGVSALAAAGPEDDAAANGCRGFNTAQDAIALDPTGNAGDATTDAMETVESLLGGDCSEHGSATDQVPDDPGGGNVPDDPGGGQGGQP